MPQQHLHRQSYRCKRNAWHTFLFFYMETAAAAHTCYLNNVPFVAIRSISDNIKEAGQEAINRNYDKAAYRKD